MAGMIPELVNKAMVGGLKAADRTTTASVDRAVEESLQLAGLGSDELVIQARPAETLVSNQHIADHLSLLDKISGRQPQLDQFRVIAKQARGAEQLGMVADKATAYGSWYERNSAQSWATAYFKENSAARTRIIDTLTQGQPSEGKVREALDQLNHFKEDRQGQLNGLRTIAQRAHTHPQFDAVGDKAKEYGNWYKRNSATDWATAMFNVNNDVRTKAIDHLTAGEAGPARFEHALGELDQFEDARQPQLNAMRTIAGRADERAEHTLVADKARSYATWYGTHGSADWQQAYSNVNNGAISRIIGEG